MSIQQSEARQEVTESNHGKRGNKDKPVILECRHTSEVMRKWWKRDWFKIGRYRDTATVRKVVEQQLRQSDRLEYRMKSATKHKHHNSTWIEYIT